MDSSLQNEMGWNVYLIAEKAVSEARTGILTDEDTIGRINAIITPLARNGQSLHLRRRGAQETGMFKGYSREHHPEA